MKPISKQELAKAIVNELYFMSCEGATRGSIALRNVSPTSSSVILLEIVSDKQRLSFRTWMPRENKEQEVIERDDFSFSKDMFGHLFLTDIIDFALQYYGTTYNLPD